jgi:hypothetical protein
MLGSASDVRLVPEANVNLSNDPAQHRMRWPFYVLLVAFGRLLSRNERRDDSLNLASDHL